jgi:hypothetical protein
MILGINQAHHPDPRIPTGSQLTSKRLELTQFT